MLFQVKNLGYRCLETGTVINMKLFSKFLATMCFFLFIYGVSFFFQKDSPKWKKEVLTLAREIDEFEKMKKGYEIRASFHLSQAQKLGASEENILTAKRHHILALENQKIVAKLKEDIGDLSDKKNQILEKIR